MVPTYPGLFKAISTVSRLLHVYKPLLMDIFSSTEFLTDTCNCRTTKSGAPLEIYCFHDYHTFQSADHLCPFPEKQMQSSPINCQLAELISQKTQKWLLAVMNKRNRGTWRSTSMLVLGSKFTKCLWVRALFCSHQVNTPMLYVIEEGCKQLLEMVLMGDSITWDIFHKSAYQVAWIWHSTIIITV